MEKNGNEGTLIIPSHLLTQIHAHGESAYPEEGAGLLLGLQEGGSRQVRSLIKITNARESSARRNRYLITPQDMLLAEEQAARLGLNILGVFHSHPDHPGQPSKFDKEWALPRFSYLITSVYNRIAQESRSWRLLEIRSSFKEEPIIINDP